MDSAQSRSRLPKVAVVERDRKLSCQGRARARISRARISSVDRLSLAAIKSEHTDGVRAGHLGIKNAWKFIEDDFGCHDDGDALVND
jgi:hypothetical protein